VVDNVFTLMNTIVEFKTVSGAGGNEVYAMGDFALLESEVNPVLQQIIAYDWTVLNLHPHMKEETPKMQMLHWQARGDLNTILTQVSEALSLTSIGQTPPIQPQTALDGEFIANRLNGVLVNGAVADVLIPRQDDNIVSSLNPDVTLNDFVMMGSGFEFMAMPGDGNMTTEGATSGNVMMMGDFALLESEVDAVEQAFLCSDLPGVTSVSVTGQHSHMLEESPKIMFVHVEAQGELNQVIDLINMALDQTTMRGNGAPATPPC